MIKKITFIGSVLWHGLLLVLIAGWTAPFPQPRVISETRNIHLLFPAIQLPDAEINGPARRVHMIYAPNFPLHGNDTQQKTENIAAQLPNKRQAKIQPRAGILKRSGAGRELLLPEISGGRTGETGFTQKFLHEKNYGPKNLISSYMNPWRGKLTYDSGELSEKNRIRKNNIVFASLTAPRMKTWARFAVSRIARIWQQQDFPDIRGVVARVEVVVECSGRISSFSPVEVSGNSSLKEKICHVIRSASPLPAFPETCAQKNISGVLIFCLK